MLQTNCNSLISMWNISTFAEIRETKRYFFCASEMRTDNRQRFWKRGDSLFIRFRYAVYIENNRIAYNLQNCLHNYELITMLMYRIFRRVHQYCL